MCQFEKHYRNDREVEGPSERDDENRGDFFLESSERHERIKHFLSQELLKQIDQNEERRKEITFGKKFNSSIGTKIKMSKEELRAKIEEQTKIRNDLLHSKNLKKEELKLQNDLKDLKEFSKNRVADLKSQESKRELEVRRSKEQIFKMKSMLQLLKTENKTWKSIDEGVGMESNLWEMITEQKKANWIAEQKIKDYSMEIETRLSGACYKFACLQFYIEQQLRIGSAAACELEQQKEIMKKHEMIEQFENLRKEEAKCRPRPNARKLDLFHNFHLLHKS